MSNKWCGGCEARAEPFQLVLLGPVEERRYFFLGYLAIFVSVHGLENSLVSGLTLLQRDGPVTIART